MKRQAMAKSKKTPKTADALGEGMLLDYISGAPKKENAKELVRQRIARALFHEYAISVEDMEADFAIKVDGRRKRADIAIFKPGTEHAEEDICRVVICRPEPKNGKKGATKMRDHEQAENDLAELKALMASAEQCQYGLWTNGLDFFFLQRKATRFDVKFQPLGDWPMGDETPGTRDVASDIRMRRADPEMLRIAFRRCHNFIHGNEGMQKDKAFWQFLYLIFSKMHDEQRNGGDRRFWVGPTEQFDPAGRKAIRQRILPLFEEVKKEHRTVFRGNEEITLSDRALAFMVSELSKYDMTRTDIDAKGAAYQEIVGTNLRGDRGQYFTPRGAIKLMVEMMAPKPTERVLDPACGTGGFLVAALAHIQHGLQDEAGLGNGQEDQKALKVVQKKLSDFTLKSLFGCDFDQDLVRTAQMNVLMASNAMGNFAHLNSLEFPSGHLDGVAEAKKKAQLGTMDVVLTNPPFGSDIPITDPHILRQFELAQIWERTDESSFRSTGRLQGSVAPEVLFIERCIQWLKPGGRMAIVLPDGILGNPGDEYIRAWILRHAYVLASVDLPVEAFIVEANVNILTGLLFLKKKTEKEISAVDLGGQRDYPVFMAVAEKVGFDRRGNTLHKRHPDGEEILETVKFEERIKIGGKCVTRTLERKQKVVDDDLPLIAKTYSEFRAKTKEPGP